MSRTHKRVGVDVQIETHAGGDVARLTLNRPEKLNALNEPTIRTLHQCVLDLHHSTTLRVLVLTGAGDKSFSAGADINELSELTPASARQFITLLHQAHSALRALRVPVICRVNGFCLGAGLEMAVSCDIRVAVEHAVFGMPEVQVGLPSVIEAALLPRLIGWGKTNDLLMTGRNIEANEALQCGLVETVVPAPDLDAAVEERVSAILQAGPVAVRAQKRLMREWEYLPLGQAVSRGIDYLETAYQTDEPRRLMKARSKTRD